MLGAFLTTLFFSLSGIFASRSVREVGQTRANLGRLLVAFIGLGTYAHLFGKGLGGAGRDWFLLSGIAGMGIGDLALFMALPLLGSRLTVLVTQCLAAPIAMLVEWLWLGTTLTAPQLGFGLIILGGVSVALMPSRKNPPRVPVKLAGFVFGVISALGQGLGAVLSRKANALTELAGEPIDGISAAYVRIAGGLVLTGAYFAIKALIDHRKAVSPAPSAPTWKAHVWIPLNALCGAIIGVSCYQWALATTPSGIVLPIVAATPLVIVPLSYWLEGERPTRRSLVGGLIAVAGAVSLALAR